MELGTLTAKSIRNLLKRGCGLKEFCDRYECTADDLCRKVRTLYSRDTHTAEELLTQMKENDKKPKRQKPKDTSSEAEADEVVEEEMGTDEAATEDDAKLTLAEKMAKMKAQEDALSAEVMGIESEHKRLAEAHRENIVSLRGLSEEIKEIKATFKAKCAEYEKIVATCNEIGVQMNQVSERRRARVVELETIRERIEGFKALDIGVYSDGKIEVFNYPDLRLDETGFEAVYDRIIDLPECQELRVKEVQILARLLKAIEISSMQVNVLFDSEELELAYMLLTESAK